MKDLLCPHRVPHQQWAFRDEMPVAQQARTLVVLNSRACPDCLQGRLKNLRAAFEALRDTVSAPGAMTTEQRVRAEQGFRLYYDDMKVWGP